VRDSFWVRSCLALACLCARRKKFYTIATSSTNVPVSIEQKVFGGKIQTTYECCRCHTVSIHKETFSELLLPFPDSRPETAVATSSEMTEPSTKKDLTMQVR